MFREGRIDYERLMKLKSAVGKEHIVLDLSCRRRQDGPYCIVTDRWQRFTDTELDAGVFDSLADYCDEFLVHAVDVEGKRSGIDEAVLKILAGVPYTVTYAGGVASLEDIEIIKRRGMGRVDVTIGSALRLFGGHLDIEEVVRCIQ